MKKKFAKLNFYGGVGLLLGGILGCTSHPSSEQKKTPVLVMGLSADYPPFEFKKKGEFAGFDVDVATEVAKELGYTLLIQDMDFSGLIPALQSGRIDFAMSGMTITEERKKNVEFSRTYFKSSFAILVDQASIFAGEKDLAGKKVGVQLGTTLEKFAKEKAKEVVGMEIVALAKNPILIQELKSGRIDGVIFEDVQALAFVEANPNLKSVALSGKSPEGYAVAFSKSNPKGSVLRDDFNRVLEQFEKSGMLQKIRSKWLGK